MAIDWKAARHLPWGCWLRANGGMLEDQDGCRWHSVRDAFWRGRMNFPLEHLVTEQLELLLRVLTAIERRWLSGNESKHDIFGGDMLFWRFYCCWLASIGLTETDRGLNALAGPLSDEGHSAMLMLQATREPAWIDLPMEEVVDAVRRSMLHSDLGRDASFDQFQRAVAFRRNVFAREAVGNRHLITLTGFENTGRMPIRRVMWSASFGDETTRDTLYAWLAERVDRWDEWSGLAYGAGASTLTHHLFTLFLADGPPGF